MIQHRYLQEPLNAYLLLNPLFNTSPKSLSNVLTLIESMSMSVKIYAPIHANFFFNNNNYIHAAIYYVVTTDHY